MATNSMGQGTEERVGNGASKPAGANGMSTGYEHITRYGDEAAWTNVVWIIIVILCACGLTVLVVQWAATKFS
jgi:hypothetical protein